jgi:hypothetical protein
MRNRRRQRWGVGLVAGLAACAAVGVAPARAQSVPVIVPPVAPIVVGSPASIPPVVVGIPGSSGAHGRGGITWTESGRAQVTVDVDRHHGRAAAR